MTSSCTRRLLLTAALLTAPAIAFAQEAVLTGTVTDSTGAVLPGVTVIAVHEATGNRFETVTDGQGAFRVPARVGTFQLTASLQGFATVTRTGLQLLVGQTAVNLQMAPSTVRKLTVTAEAPLLNGDVVEPRRERRRSRCRGCRPGAELDVARDAGARQPRLTNPGGTTPLPDRNQGEQRSSSSVSTVRTSPAS